jgi:very-short-patch-repair endonuclease
MTEALTVENLRDAIGRTLQKAVKEYDLENVCAELGIASSSSTSTSKWRTVLNWLPTEMDSVLPIARLVAGRFPNYRLEELVWRIDDESPEITELARRKIVEALEGLADPWGQLGAPAVLGVAFPLDDMPPYDRSRASFDLEPHTLASDVFRHLVRNPDDWTMETLAYALKLFDVSGRRFRKFLAAMFDPKIREPDVQTRLATSINETLRRCGWELRIAGEDTGLPVYDVFRSGRGVAGKAKNVIFASRVKPDLRFTDAISNDIEIVTQADEVLVYDQPILGSGLLWRDLQAWWAGPKGLPAADPGTKEQLYRRLRSSLPDNSPPQANFFRAFHAVYKNAFDDLPALLPEVWLHYDPRTIEQRGRDALLRQRMDFLMLLPHGVRVVLEVDGAQHFSDEAGRASPSEYASLARADRELRLLGYEVYRFGGAELGQGAAERVVKEFFDGLFTRHGIDSHGIPARTSR